MQGYEDYENLQVDNGQSSDEGPSIEQIVIQKKREKFLTEIRSSKKKEILSQSRVRMFQKYAKEPTDQEKLSSIVPEFIYSNPEKMKAFLSSLIEGIGTDYQNYSLDYYQKLTKSIQHVRLLSSRSEYTSIISQMIQANIHSILIKLMSEENNRELRIESAWLLNNCLSSDCYDLTLNINENYQDILNSFIRLFIQSEDEQLFEIGLWGITNLIIESSEAANLFCKSHGFSYFLEMLQKHTNNYQIKETIAWAMTAFSNYQEMMQKSQKLQFAQIAENFILKSESDSIINYGIRILYHQSKDDQVCAAISKRISLMDALIKFIDREELISYAIAIIGNLISCESSISKILLERRVLQSLSQAIDSVRQDVRFEALWCISNLFSGDEEEIQQVLDNYRLVEKIFRLAKMDSPKNVMEICIGLANCLGRANNLQLMNLIEKGILEIFIGFFAIQDLQITLKTLQGVLYLLEFGEKTKQEEQTNPIKLALAQLGFEQYLFSLQYHPHSEVYELTFQILKDFYSDSLKIIPEPYNNFDPEI